MVEVYKTNVCNARDAETVLRRLSSYFPSFECNFDLEDCDRILRIDSCHAKLSNPLVLQAVSELGFLIEVLSGEVSGS